VRKAARTGLRKLLAGEGERAEAHEHVVQDRDHRRHPALEVESKPDVHQDPGQARRHGIHRLQLEIAAHLGADEFDAADVERAEGGIAGQGGLDAGRDLAGRVRDLRRADDIFRRIPELLNHAAPQADAGQRRPELRGLRRVLETNLYERAAREIEVVSKPLKKQRDEALAVIMIDTA
jgi:hypothetical protein